MTEADQHDAPGTTSGVRPGLQPFLHDLASCVAAPGLLLASADGQVRPGGVSGWYVADRRLLDTVVLEVEGSGLDLVRAATVGAARQEFSYVARGLGDHQPDPTVRLDRVRELTPTGFAETVVVESTAQEPVDLVVHLRIGGDLAPMTEVKQGATPPPVGPRATSTGLRLESEHATVDLAGEGAEIDAGGRLTWRFGLDRGARRELRLSARADVAGLFGSGAPATWAVAVEAADVRVARTAAQSLADLDGLLLDDDGDRFLAAGSPWFLTLFGRDSLWAARMMVPFDTGLALSTLRVLAKRQGTRLDVTSEEEPGKILHEVRNGELDLGALVLPPVYFGSVDATPLFVATLADAHEWGADPDAVRSLLPAARGCLTWMLEQSAETGWLRYVDRTGRGLANQGWKDSPDSVQFADGRLADPPIALCEVQAYAYEAAVRGADLLAAYGEEEVPGLRDWAARLAERFAEDFWVGSADGGHVAIALDRDGRRADSVTSNLGHVLGTGLLPADRASRVADLLADPRLDSGFGLRTLAADSPRFSRLSYHGGSVWPHDTAIAVRGLAAEGRREEAARLARGLFVAAEGFGYRLPELYGGDAASDVPLPSAYPAACRPQAWSAAAPLAVLVAVAGVRVDPTAREVRHPAFTSRALGPYTVRGLRAGQAAFDLHVHASGAVRVDLVTPGGWSVVAEPAQE